MRAAKNRDEHIGRPPALESSEVQEARTMFDRGESPPHVGWDLRVGWSTLCRVPGRIRPLKTAEAFCEVFSVRRRGRRACPRHDVHRWFPHLGLAVAIGDESTSSS